MTDESRQRSRGRLQFDDIASLQRLNPTWKLLRADNAPLILAVLGRIFVEDQVREIAATDLINRVDDALYAINQRMGDNPFPKPAQDYLNDWSTGETRWLRKFYIRGSNEARYDATPALDRAVSFIESLRDREFVGTESRLHTAYDLLRQIVHGSDTDKERRLVELKRRKAEIEAEIEATEQGHFTVMDDLSRRDRYQQFVDLAMGLLADFREVEANMRTWDRQLREKIATWNGTKGQLLDAYVDDHNELERSDQVRSLNAFHDVLQSSERYNELTELIARVNELVDPVDADDRMRRVTYDWISASHRVMTIKRQLADQLRSFLKEQDLVENNRILEIMRNIETIAIELRDEPKDNFWIEVDALSPELHTVFGRSPHIKPHNTSVDSTTVQVAEDIEPSESLYEQTYADTGPLIVNIRSRLHRHGRTTLSDLLAETPLKLGLEELLTYMTLDAPDFDTISDESAEDTVTWDWTDGGRRIAQIPRIIFTPNTGGRR